MITELPAEAETDSHHATATHCPYCAFQCGMHLGRTPGEPLIVGNAAFPVNKGALCIKGWTSGAALAQAFRDIRERY